MFTLARKIHKQGSVENGRPQRQGNKQEEKDLRLRERGATSFRNVNKVNAPGFVKFSFNIFETIRLCPSRK